MPSGKGVLRIAIEDFIETFDLGKSLWNWQRTVLEKFEEELLELYDEFYANFEYKEFVPELLTPARIKGTVKKRPVQIIPIVIAIGMMLLGLFIGMFAPLQRIGSYKVDAKVKSYRPSPLEGYTIAHRLYGENAVPEGLIKDLGLPEEIAKGYEALSRQLLSPLDYAGSWRRGLMSDDEFIKQLRSMGFETKTIDLFINLTQIIPNVQDLIRFSVREAFSPDVIQRFHYDEAFPDEVLQYTKKLGLSDEWVKRYWFAHWELPSPQMGYEMLHRLREGRTEQTFTSADLDLLLRTADFAPYFRDRMKAISYNPITRVDVRRIFKLGIFDASEVKERYMDLGYTERDAQLLADFTVKFESEDGSDKRQKYKDLTLGTYKRLYIKDVITESDFHDKIIGLGYDEDEAKLIIELANLENTDDVAIDFKQKFINDTISDTSNALANRLITTDDAHNILSGIGISDANIEYIINKEEYDASLRDLNDNIKFIRESYVSGAMTRNDMIGDLGKLGITGNQQNKLIEDLELALKYRNRRLSESEYRKAMIAGIITSDEYATNLIGLGFTDYDINILLALYAPTGA